MPDLCGDFGGLTNAGEPCKRKTVDGGPCPQHSGKDPGGRPRIEIEPDQVKQIEKLAAVLTLEQIADFLGMSQSTARRRMQEDPQVLKAYQRGKGHAIAGVAMNLIQQARSGNTTAAIFYLKTQGGWKETTVNEHTGELPVIMVKREA